MFFAKVGRFLEEDGDFCIDLEKEDDEIEDFGVIMRRFACREERGGWGVGRKSEEEGDERREGVWGTGVWRCNGALQVGIVKRRRICLQFRGIEVGVSPNKIVNSHRLAPYFITMIRSLLFFLLICSAFVGKAQSAFDRYFRDSTLRIDYVFAGTDSTQSIAVDELKSFAGWAGRKVNMEQVPLKGNGELVMRDAQDGRVLYRHSFSTLFQEWQSSEEATQVRRSFENVFLLPFPRRDVRVTVSLYDSKGRTVCQMTHPVKVDDILIRPVSAPAAPWCWIHRGNAMESCIDLVIVGEGYKAEAQEEFFAKAKAACDEIMKYAPFSEYRDRFNVRAVALASPDNGVSIPHAGVWKQTALSSHFDTFYSERYLTTLKLKNLHDALGNLPYEHIIILANTEQYGGGGIYNSYVLSAAKNRLFLPVTVHEFGHSFGGLADEYFYDDQYSNFYSSDVEPWEQNITTLADFGSKWQDMLPRGTKIPTSSKGLAELDMHHIGVYEGGGYMSKGVYRPYVNCRMRTNEVPEFCGVCRRALRRMIEFYTRPQ